jgi:hypothetical protein
MGSTKFCKSGKVLYGDEYKAWNAAYRVIELGVMEDAKVYICPHCRHYHLTTAKVQLHNWLWRQSRMGERDLRKGCGYASVRNWFRQRGTIDTWDDK